LAIAAITERIWSVAVSIQQRLTAQCDIDVAKCQPRRGIEASLSAQPQPKYPCRAVIPQADGLHA
jgi:hypothetical protein